MVVDDMVPAPPTRFRCNRSRMLLNIKVTLHHVGAGQINLKTSRSKIELDTMQAHRKYRLNRAYPRGIECDDSKTTARLEHGMLIVEMPINKLPSVVPNGAVDDPESEPPANTAVKKRKASPSEAASGAGKVAATIEEGLQRPGGGVHGSGKAKKRPRSAEAEDDARGAEDAVAVARPKKGKKGSGGGAGASGGGGAGEADLMLAALNEAVDTEAARRGGSLAKMKKLQAAEAAAKERAETKEAEREQKKRELLESFKRQKAERKAATKGAKAQLAREAALTTPVGGDGKPKKKKKRFSFSPKITDE